MFTRTERPPRRTGFVVAAAALALALVVSIATSSAPADAQTTELPPTSAQTSGPRAIVARTDKGSAGLLLITEYTDATTSQRYDKREFFSISQLLDNEWGELLWALAGLDPSGQVVVVPDTTSVTPRPTPTATTIAPVAPTPSSPSAFAPGTGTAGVTPAYTGPTDFAALKASGPITITTPGAVITNVDVAGKITVAADNVTIRNFRANNVEQAQGSKGLVLEDGEIHGAQDPMVDGVTWSDYTARRLNVHGVTDAFKAHGNVVIENSWIHDLAFVVFSTGGWTHNDGVQISSGSNITIRGNRFEGNQGNAAVFIDPDFGPISNVTVEGNYLGGGGYTLYSVPSPKAAENGNPTNVIVRNNVFSEEHLFAYATIAKTGTTFTNNLTTTGAAVTAIPWS